MPRELLKASAVKVNTGAGCLFQPLSPQFTYVLTARHCLLDHRLSPPYARIPVADIDVYAYSETGEPTRLTVLDCVVSPVEAQDIAVLLVEKVTGYRQTTSCTDPIWGEEALAFGYPAFRGSASQPVEYLTCLLRLSSAHSPTFDVDAQSTLFTFNRGGIENSKGFSGAGIYVTRGEQAHLVGILTEVKNPDGVFDRLTAVRLEAYNKLLESGTYAGSQLPTLVPEYLASFSSYLSRIFQYDNRRLETLLREASDSIIAKGINPYSILEKFQHTLFLPYGRPTSLTNHQLWQGWLELLTFLSFEDESFASLKEVTWKNRYFFYMGESSWGNVVKYIHVDLAGKFKSGARFIFNNHTSPPEPSKPNAQRISRILPNIASGNDLMDMAGRMNIDESQIAAQFMFVHLQEFKKVFASAEEELALVTNPAELKLKIQLLLNSVFAHD